jgi:hypothetical protein
MSEISDQQLWDYIDRLLSPGEMAEIEYLLAHDEEISKRINALMRVHSILGAHGFSNTVPSISVKENILMQFDLRAQKLRVSTFPKDINLIAGLVFSCFIIAVAFLFLFLGDVFINSRIFLFNMAINNNIMIVPATILLILMCLFINNLLGYKRMIKQIS